MSGYRRRGGTKGPDRYGPTEGDEYSEDPSYMLQQNDQPAAVTASAPQQEYALRRDNGDDDDASGSQMRRDNGRDHAEDVFQDEGSVDYDGPEMSISELLYSTSSFYAIIVPVTITMTLSALAVVYINNDDTVEEGAQQMAQAYQVWSTNEASGIRAIALSLANSFVMVCVICLMTFVIVLLYKHECIKCLIGYMMICSTTLLGFLGGHMFYVAIQIYRLPVDQLSFYLSLWNFAAVGVTAIFLGNGIPKYVTQGYLICTSVILAWHLSYFDEYMTWALLFMLALYDLCAVLTPCGPLRALVNLMSRDNAPDMPGLLYEADLPPEARRPDTKKKSVTLPQDGGAEDERADAGPTGSGPMIEVPLAVARVYNLPVLGIPDSSKGILGLESSSRRGSTSAPLLGDDGEDEVYIPDDPTPTQLIAGVLVKLPKLGGRIEKVRRGGKSVFLERDRFGNPKRVLWVDRMGRVFAESADAEDSGDRNSIRLGLGDFIFYSVLVSKAAQYSFTTFAACILVILAGLGGTLVLLSVYHHALPALPISIFIGMFFYFFTRMFVEPWVEALLLKPFYV